MKDEVICFFKNKHVCVERECKRSLWKEHCEDTCRNADLWPKYLQMATPNKCTIVRYRKTWGNLASCRGPLDICVLKQLGIWALHWVWCNSLLMLNFVLLSHAAGRQRQCSGELAHGACPWQRERAPAHRAGAFEPVWSFNGGEECCWRRPACYADISHQQR